MPGYAVRNYFYYRLTGQPYTGYPPVGYTAAKYFFTQGNFTVALQYQDENDRWHNYQTIYGLNHIRDGRGDPWMPPDDNAVRSSILNRTTVEFYVNNGQAQGNKLIDDCVQGRFSPGWNSNEQEAWVHYLGESRSVRTNIQTGRGRRLVGAFKTGDDYNIDTGPATGEHFINSGGAGTPRYWTSNRKGTDSTYYTDRDFVDRAGDSIQGTNLFDSSAAAKVNRPLILNRPFRSVAELGYVFRDNPWQSINLYAENSADSGLLDVFYIGDGRLHNVAAGDRTGAVVAGKINLNSAARDWETGAASPVLDAIVSGAALDYCTDTVSGTVSGSGVISFDTGKIARPVASYPLASVSDLPAVIPLNSSLTTKGQREAVLRALTGSVQTRTWNLLVDIIAQVGRYGPSAGALREFIVEGEKHYWLHVAVDRFTGEVVDQQLEPVQE